MIRKKYRNIAYREETILFILLFIIIYFIYKFFQKYIIQFKNIEAHKMGKLYIQKSEYYKIRQ